MVNWITSEDEKNIKKIDYDSLCKVMKFIKKQDTNDEMVNYVCKIFDEYKNVLKSEPLILHDSLKSYYGSNFVENANLKKSDIIVSSSDINAYYTIKNLNKEKKDLTIICFDMHSDTYDYNDFLWKGNSFSKLMKEGYLNHFIVIGVPMYKRKMCMDDTNIDLRRRVHLIDEKDIFKTLEEIKCKNVFISIDADCFDCRRSLYTAVEYSPSTILNYVSHIKGIDKINYKNKIHECVQVKNELGYSNYYHTGENDLTVDNVIDIKNKIVTYCSKKNINLGLDNKKPYLQIMEVNGYDYCGLTTKMVIKLIDNCLLKEVI